MRFQLIEKTKYSMTSLWNGLWFAALMGALLSLMGSLEYFWAVLPGITFVIIMGFLPRRHQSFAGLAILVACAIWFIARSVPILHGLGFLMNRLFAISEANQDYYYTYFSEIRAAPAESLFFVSCVLSLLCIGLGAVVYLVLTLLMAIMIAYFSVVPGIVYLCILLIAAFANALPKYGRLLPTILIAAFIATTAFSIQSAAPEPDLQASVIVEEFWEIFVPVVSPEDMENHPGDIPAIEVPIPDGEGLGDGEDIEIPGDFELPEGLEGENYTGVPELPAEDEGLSPGGEGAAEENGGEQKDNGRKLAVVIRIAVVVLVILSAVAAWFLYITGKRKRNRAVLYENNNTEAICGMYLYAKKWRKLQQNPEEIPLDVKAIWLEAAYSEHKMTNAQRKVMRAYVKASMEAAWSGLKWWERLIVYWYYAL